MRRLRLLVAARSASTLSEIEKAAEDLSQFEKLQARSVNVSDAKITDPTLRKLISAISWFIERSAIAPGPPMVSVPSMMLMSGAAVLLGGNVRADDPSNKYRLAISILLRSLAITDVICERTGLSLINAELVASFGVTTLRVYMNHRSSGSVTTFWKLAVESLAVAALHTEIQRRYIMTDGVQKVIWAIMDIADVALGADSVMREFARTLPGIIETQIFAGQSARVLDAPMDLDAPDVLMCGICRDFLKRPVVSRGFFFCRDCLSRWFRDSNTLNNPMTGLPMTDNDTTRSLAMQSLVNRYITIATANN